MRDCAGNVSASRIGKLLSHRLQGLEARVTVAARKYGDLAWAEAYGLRGFRVRTREEMERTLDEALASGTGAVIDCMLDIDEMVRPMVAAGSPITDFLLD